MQLGFVSAILGDLSLEQVLSFARDEGFDPIAFNEQTHPFAQGARLSIEQPKIREQDRSRRRGWNRLRGGMSRQSERCD